MHWIKLSGGQRQTLIRFLTNAGTIALGGLIVGPFIGQKLFHRGMFGVGSVLYAILLWLALLLSEKEP